MIMNGCRKSQIMTRIYCNITARTCVVIIKKVDGYTLEELADLFFADILKNKEIFLVIVLYKKHADKLIQIHSGKYFNRQNVDIGNLQKLDEVIILHRK